MIMSPDELRWVAEVLDALNNAPDGSGCGFVVEDNRLMLYWCDRPMGYLSFCDEDNQETWGFEHIQE